MLLAVGVVGLNARLGCLRADLAPDSEAQKMIDAANFSFVAVNDLEHNLPLWKLFVTPLLRKLYDAQDFITEWVSNPDYRQMQFRLKTEIKNDLFKINKTDFWFNSTTIKYINRTVKALKASSPENQNEDLSIIEELLVRGMSPSSVTTTVIDLLMAGVDTVSQNIRLPRYLNIFLMISTHLLAEFQYHRFLDLFLGEESWQARKVATGNSFRYWSKRKSHKCKRSKWSPLS